MSHIHPGGESGDIAIRRITEAELPAWRKTVDAGFLRPAGTTEARLEHVPYAEGRFTAAYAGARVVGALRSFTTELTVPGGTPLAADALTHVAVLPSHRRRGLLTRLVGDELRAAAGRGEPVAVLVAAEPTVYGRYGFGPVTRLGGYEVDVPRCGGVRVPPEAGTVEALDPSEVREVGPVLHERFRRGQPGAVARDPRWWRVDTGGLRHPLRSPSAPLCVAHRDRSGEVTGLLLYSLEESWDGGLPDSRLVVLDLLALDATATAALWGYCLSLDWVTRVSADNLAPDDPLPLLLGNPRAARASATDCDFLWLRLLDLPEALGARTYASAGRVTLRVTDEAGYAHGHFTLETTTDGTGTCTRTETGPADLALDVSTLAPLYLGLETLPRLHAAGLVEELHPGAVKRADLMLRTPLRPWCPDGL
ncbi:GNAT family N-acetyltransferase [Streptomyces cinereoruber]|uniref:GNAT family N-acetyltransferase n=1 Tax=Streptomyces cinereoruber TaxID=67260 RepID=UPI003EBBC8DD